MEHFSIQYQGFENDFFGIEITHGKDGLKINISNLDFGYGKTKEEIIEYKKKAFKEFLESVEKVKKEA